MATWPRGLRRGRRALAIAVPKWLTIGLRPGPHEPDGLRNLCRPRNRIPLSKNPRQHEWVPAEGTWMGIDRSTRAFGAGVSESVRAGVSLLAAVMLALCVAGCAS